MKHLSPPPEIHPVDEWLTSHELERTGAWQFTSAGRPSKRRRWGAALMAQSLLAGAQTSALKTPTALTAQFLRAATMADRVTYELEPLSDGRRLVRRAVRAMQGGRLMALCTVSFGDTPGPYAHATPRPDAPEPETLADWWEPLVKRLNLGRAPNAWDLRSVGSDYPHVTPGELPWRRTWARPKRALPDDPLIHAAAILSVSDRALTATTGLAYERQVMTSLDHAIWWHEPPRFDDWLLYASDSPRGFGGRTLIRGMFHTRDGRHVASVAQEAMALE